MSEVASAVITAPFPFDLARPITPAEVAAVAREEEHQAAEPVEVPERLKTPPEPRRDRCTWTENEMGQWDTGCGHCFELSDSDGPLAHGMRFCCYCGGRLAEVPWAYGLPLIETECDE